MKIDSDLRAVIRAAEKVQLKKGSNHYDRRIEYKNAIATLFKKKPTVKVKAEKIIAEIKRYKELLRKAENSLDALGIDDDFDWISDESAFVKQGGVMPLFNDEPWKADKVIAELAAANPKDLKSILLKYGMRWD